MIRRNQAVLNRLNGFADFVIVLGSYLFSSWFRLRVLTHDVVNTALTGRMILAAAIYAVMLLTVLAVMGFYGTTRTRKMSWKLKILLAGLTVSVLAASALFYVIRLEDFSRGIIVIFYVLTFLLLGGKYVVMRLLLEQLRAQGQMVVHPGFEPVGEFQIQLSLGEVGGELRQNALFQARVVLEEGRQQRRDAEEDEKHQNVNELEAFFHIPSPPSQNRK